MKTVINLHFGKRRIQSFWSLTILLQPPFYYFYLQDKKSSDNTLQNMHFSCIIDHRFNYFVSFSLQSDDAHEAKQDRAGFQVNTDIHRSTVHGQALVK